MHSAALSSPRLQRLLEALSDGRPHSTRNLVHSAEVMAVSATVAELREHGAVIHCQARHVEGHRRFFYTMTKGPDLEGSTDAA